LLSRNGYSLLLPQKTRKPKSGKRVGRIKNIKTMKYKLFFFVVALSFSTKLTIGQGCLTVPPANQDRVALPTTISPINTCTTISNSVTTTSNTGYELYNDQDILGGNGTNCRVMVWDGTLASFSWDYGGTPATQNSIPLFSLPGIPNQTLADPDVVVQNVGNNQPLNVWAMVVGIVTGPGPHANEIYWQCFQWDNLGSVFHASTVTGKFGFLGTPGAISSNPNIDVNACGIVAITWHTVKSVTINITVPPPLTGGPITYDRNDVYAAYGRIDAPCVISGVAPSGDLVSNNSAADQLFEKNSTPDVCISDNLGGNCTSAGNGTYCVTFTWQQSGFKPAAFAFINSVFVKQYNIDINPGGCLSGAPNQVYSNALDFGGNGGRPRIAARPTDNLGQTSFATDFQIVLAYYSLTCNVAYNCPTTTSCSMISSGGIFNWGRQNNINMPAPTDLALQGCAVGTYHFDNAVVSYLNRYYTGGNGNVGNYVVAFEYGPEPFNCGTYTGSLLNPASGISYTPNATETDIFARTYNNGLAITPMYSIVNYSYCTGGQWGVSKQTIPSIASRHGFHQIGWDFWDQYRNFIAYKASAWNILPGNSTTGLRLKNPDIEEIALPDAAAESRFIASPNPFTNEINFSYKLMDGETSGTIEIYDLNGNLIDKTNVENSSQEKAITLNLPPGIYIAKLKTNNRELVTRITKSE
jgi:hypothetical protein